MTLQGVWNCFNYTRTRHLRQARGLVSSLMSSMVASRHRTLSIGDITEPETRFTSIGAAANTAVSPHTKRSLLDDNDDELLTYFSNSWPRNDLEYDQDSWIPSIEYVPTVPSFYPLCEPYIVIPTGNDSVLSITDRIKQTLRDRSIVAAYDSRGAKADCTTKNNVSFRIRLYRSSRDSSAIIVEIQRREGFNVLYYQDVHAIFDAAEGNEIDGEINQDSGSYLFSPDDFERSYTQSSLDRLSDILCSDNDAVTFEVLDMALSVLISLTNIEELGRAAILTSNDLMNSERFAKLRDKIISHALLSDEASSPIQNESIRFKHLSLETLANAVSCFQDDGNAVEFQFSRPMLKCLISLVEDANTDPRAADLACLILKYTSKSKHWNKKLKARLKSSLESANRHGNKMHADLKAHSEECMSLLDGVFS